MKFLYKIFNLINRKFLSINRSYHYEIETSKTWAEIKGLFSSDEIKQRFLISDVLCACGNESILLQKYVASMTQVGLSFPTEPDKLTAEITKPNNNLNIFISLEYHHGAYFIPVIRFVNYAIMFFLLLSWITQILNHTFVPGKLAAILPLLVFNIIIWIFTYRLRAEADKLEKQILQIIGHNSFSYSTSK